MARAPTHCCSRRRPPSRPPSARAPSPATRRSRAARAGSPSWPRSGSTSTPRATSPRCAARSRRARAGRRGRGRCSTASPPRTPPDVAALAVEPLPALPELRPGDDLAALLGAAGARLDPPLGPGDVLAVAHKVVSKAEGRLRALAAVDPGQRARALAAEHDKDPRHVQAILDETAELLRANRGRLICRTRHGFVCANAGVDQSNTGEPDTVVLLPEDPDASARALRAALGVGAVVITDSWGRPWRQGQVEVAIGSAGLRALVDHRGYPDRDGREMAASVIAVADEVAAAADLVRKKTSGEPAVRVRGLEELLTEENEDGAASLIRPPEDDLFK